MPVLGLMDVRDHFLFYSRCSCRIAIVSFLILVVNMPLHYGQAGRASIEDRFHQRSILGRALCLGVYKERFFVHVFDMF